MLADRVTVCMLHVLLCSQAARPSAAADCRQHCLLLPMLLLPVLAFTRASAASASLITVRLLCALPKGAWQVSKAYAQMEWWDYMELWSTSGNSLPLGSRDWYVQRLASA